MGTASARCVKRSPPGVRPLNLGRIALVYCRYEVLAIVLEQAFDPRQPVCPSNCRTCSLSAALVGGTSIIWCGRACSRWTFSSKHMAACVT